MPSTKKIVVARMRRTSTRKGEFQRTSTRETRFQNSVTVICPYTKRSDAGHSATEAFCLVRSRHVDQTDISSAGPTRAFTARGLSHLADRTRWSIRSGNGGIREKRYPYRVTSQEFMPAIMNGRSGAENEFVQRTTREKVIAIDRVTFALAVLFGGWTCLVFVFQPFADRQWHLVAVGIALAAVTADLGRGRGRSMVQPKPLERMFGRSLWLGKSFVWGALAAWLGLLAWSAVSPGGAIPPAKSDPVAIRVLTWNILHGADSGMPWQQMGGRSEKKRSQGSGRDEARHPVRARGFEEQGKYLAELMPGHRRVGVGRDDGARPASIARSSSIARGSRSSTAAHFGWRNPPIVLPPNFGWARNEFAPGSGSATGKLVARFESTTRTNT